jgi:hypothetical protein
VAVGVGSSVAVETFVLQRSDKAPGLPIQRGVHGSIAPSNNSSASCYAEATGSRLSLWRLIDPLVAAIGSRTPSRSTRYELNGMLLFATVGGPLARLAEIGCRPFRAVGDAGLDVITRQCCGIV